MVYNDDDGDGYKLHEKTTQNCIASLNSLVFLVWNSNKNTVVDQVEDDEDA